jgi:hypothetical protein
MNANGSHRTAEERESHGVPYKGLSSQATTNPIHSSPLKGKALSTFRKLGALMVLTKRTSPKASSVFRRNRNWVKKTFMSR